MPTTRHTLLKILVVGAGLFAARLAHPAQANDFTAFAADEDVCRRVGAAAIKGGAGPAAAQRYDAAYRQCMVVHGRMRQMGAYPQGEPYGAGYAAGNRPGNPHGFEFPDAFYSVPYATPGYGYDGFSY